MSRSVVELCALGGSGSVQQGIHAAKELFELEQKERSGEYTQGAEFFREAGELKASSQADSILLQRMAILRQHLNIEHLSQSEYYKCMELARKEYIGGSLKEASNRIRAIELELSQGFPRESKDENLFLDQILLSNNNSVLTAAKRAKEVVDAPLLLRQISSIVAVARENISFLQPEVQRQAQAFSKKLRSGAYDRQRFLKTLCETPFCETSFKSFAYQILGLSNAEEKIEAIREREYSYLEDGSWPYLALSGPNVLEAINQLNPSADDILIEVGCGLGINAIFIGLTTELSIEGFDINPDWIDLANQIASDIGREDISFFVQDACSATYEDTTIFLIFSPFNDPTLIEKMLEEIELCAEQRAITILASYDDLINVLDEVPWVKSVGNIGAIEIYKN